MFLQLRPGQQNVPGAVQRIPVGVHEEPGGGDILPPVTFFSSFELRISEIPLKLIRFILIKFNCLKLLVDFYNACTGHCLLLPANVATYF